eukprot:358727-Chlamydomonas_euryale.AAC.3
MVACARMHAFVHQRMLEHPEASLQTAHIQQHTAMSAPGGDLLHMQRQTNFMHACMRASVNACRSTLRPAFRRLTCSSTQPCLPREGTCRTFSSKQHLPSSCTILSFSA